MAVLGVDPGESTGLALCENDGTLIRGFVTRGFDELSETWSMVRDGLSHVYCEDFVLFGPVMREGKVAIKMLGVVEYLCVSYGVPITLRPPSSRVGFLPLAEYRLIQNTINQNQFPHIRDAYAHVLAGINAKPTTEEVEWIFTHFRKTG